MFLKKVVQSFCLNHLSAKQIQYFGRPLKFKVNKFSAGALSSKEQEGDENLNESNHQEQEEQEYNNHKKVNKLKFIDDEDEQELNNINILAETSNEVILDSFSNPEFDQKKKNMIKSYSEESDDDSESTSLKTLNKEDDKHFTKEKVQFIKESLMYEGDDPYFEKLVNRPEKGVVWGLGGELLRQQKNFFEKGKFPNVESVISFLELEQGKDIICVDLEKECNRYDLPKYGIILSSFSCRHNYRIASNLLKAIKELNIPELEHRNFIISGRKDDEWLMVDFNNIAVHMFVEEAREEVDLEWKWRNPPTEEEQREFEKIQKHKARKTFFEPLDDY